MAKVKPFKHELKRQCREIFVACLPIPGFARCSAPEYSLLRCYGALHLLMLPGWAFSTNIAGALHLTAFAGFYLS